MMAVSSRRSHFAHSIQSSLFADGLVAGYSRYQVGYQHQMLTDTGVFAFCLRNCLDRHDPDDYNLGYLAGWFIGLAHIAPPATLDPAPSTLGVPLNTAPMSAKPLLPETPGYLMRLGNAFIRLTRGDTFCNGYQAGHLSFMLAHRGSHPADIHLTRLIIDAVEQDEEIALLRAGFVAGWLLTAYRLGLLPGSPQAEEVPHVSV